MSFGILLDGRLEVTHDEKTVSISEYALNRFFAADEERIKELLRFQKEALEKWLEREESFVREVFAEKERYGFDVDRYPKELIEKLKYVEGLDDEIASAKEELETIKQLLKEASP